MPLETRLLASIFGTLLSSQGSDAHRNLTQWARFWGNPSILPASILGVKSGGGCTWRLPDRGSSALGSLRESPL